MTTDEMLKELDDQASGGWAISMKEAELIAKHLRTLEAERTLLLDVLRSAQDLLTFTSHDWTGRHATLSEAIDACSHIEIKEKE